MTPSIWVGKRSLESRYEAKAKGTLARPLGWSKMQLLFFFFAAFFVAFFSLPLFLFSLPFVMESLRLQLSSQFVSCIESLKKIVKQKTHCHLPTTARSIALHRSAAHEEMPATQFIADRIVNFAHA